MTIDDARQFFVDKITAQADAEGVTLTATEREMLRFSEEFATDEMMAWNDRFDEECDPDKYEDKIARLIEHAYKADDERGTSKMWEDALGAFDGHDCYIQVMLAQAGLGESAIRVSRPPWDRTKLLLSALAVAAAMVAIAFASSQWTSAPGTSSKVLKFLDRDLLGYVYFGGLVAFGALQLYLWLLKRRRSND